MRTLPTTHGTTTALLPLYLLYAVGIPFVTAVGPGAIVRTSSFVFTPRQTSNPSLGRRPYFRTSAPLRATPSSPPSSATIGVGIDLGTTNSCISILLEDDDGATIPFIVPLPPHISYNGRTCPSVVTIAGGGGGDVRVGRAAVEGSPPLSKMYRHVKRAIGTGGEHARRQSDAVPHLVVPHYPTKKRKKSKRGAVPEHIPLEKCLAEADTFPAALLLPPEHALPDRTATTISPEELSSYLLAELLDAAADYSRTRLGVDEVFIDRAVVGVPAYFHDVQRSATERAARRALAAFSGDAGGGAPKVKLLREPEAAALAYGITHEEEGLVLVFDLGGGTFDVTVLESGGGVMEVLATGGDAALGGSDFDILLAEHMRRAALDRLVEEGGSGVQEMRTQEVTDALVRCAETVRMRLSAAKEVEVRIPTTAKGWENIGGNGHEIIVQKNQLAVDDDHGDSDSKFGPCVSIKIKRSEMEAEICRDLFHALLRPVREVALMGGALLAGDARPSMVDAALAAAAAETDMYDHDDDEDGLWDWDLQNEDQEAPQNNDGPIAQPIDAPKTNDPTPPPDEKDILPELAIPDLKSLRKAQQGGRRKARDLAARERTFRAEKQRATKPPPTSRAPSGPSGRDRASNVKIRDGFAGRPLTDVVLVGGATRTPAVSRLLAAVTGVVPDRTVNPDEAVALGAAIQVGILDGKMEETVTVLNPMQAAILRAMAKQKGLTEKDLKG